MNLYRNVIPSLSDRVWVADITSIRIASSFVIMAAILDPCSREVIGYAFSCHINTDSTLAALKAVVTLRRPPRRTCINHTGRSSQCASPRYRAPLHGYGLIGSMSAVANSYDNAQAESFMKTLKAEEVYISGYETFVDVTVRLARFVDHLHYVKRRTRRLATFHLIVSRHSSHN